jgi:membrane fusion protein, copper/silver efflux system
MKNVVLWITMAGVFSAGFLAGGRYRQREAVDATSPRARKILYYVDPMHPAYTSGKPGIAPDCGMRLEPVYEDDHGRGATVTREPRAPDVTVHVSPERQQLIGVRLAAVERTTAGEPLRAYGRVAPDETRSYRVDMGIDGYIRDLSTVTTGSQVRKDQWLATFSAPELRQPIQAYVVGLEIVDQSKRAGDSAGQLAVETASLQQGMDRLLTYGVSRTELAEISRTRVVPTNLRITAPAEGFVLRRNVSLGQKFARGDELYRLADLRRVWILAEVFGADAQRVRPGAIARVTVPGHDAALTARVSTALLPDFDPVSQAVRLRLEADNPGYRLRPDMFVDVELPLVAPPALAVPQDAIIDSGREQIAFVDRGGGTFEARRVRTGWRLGGRVEILEGLREGERVVVSGAFLLDSETRLPHVAAETGSRR